MINWKGYESKWSGLIMIISWHLPGGTVKSFRTSARMGRSPKQYIQIALFSKNFLLLLQFQTAKIKILWERRKGNYVYKKTRLHTFIKNVTHL
jgi:hypothetical protein